MSFGKSFCNFHVIKPCKLHLTMVYSYRRFKCLPEDKSESQNMSSDARNRRGFIPAALKNSSAKGVALKRLAFGEGQERLAFQFFEIGEDGQSVVGKPLVAKESRFLDDFDLGHERLDWEARDKFAARFCKIQSQAKSIAEAFNDKLDSIPNLDPDTPRVSFIDCCVYYLTDAKRGQFSVIVEPKLEGRFEKWNNNNGVSLIH